MVVDIVIKKWFKSILRASVATKTLLTLRLRGEQKKVLPAMFPSPKAPSSLDESSYRMLSVN